MVDVLIVVVVGLILKTVKVVHYSLHVHFFTETSRDLWCKLETPQVE